METEIQPIVVNIGSFPNCPKCEKGVMLPIGTIDGNSGLFASHTSANPFHAWVCSSCREHTGLHEYVGWPRKCGLCGKAELRD